MTCQEILGEGFGAFQLGSGFGRAEDFQAGCAEFVDDADHQRGFRADDGEADVLLFGESQQRRDVGGADADVFDFGFTGSAGVAGGDKDFADQR